VATIAAALALSAVPAHADTAADATGGTSTIGYSCVPRLLSLPVGSPLPVEVSTLPPITEPVGAVVSGLVAPSDLATVVAGLVKGALFDTTGVTYTLGDDETTVMGSLEPSGGFSVGDFTVPAPPSGTQQLDLHAPHSFDVTLLSSALSKLGTLACAIDASSADVLGTVLVTTASPGGASAGDTSDGNSAGGTSGDTGAGGASGDTGAPGSADAGSAGPSDVLSYSCTPPGALVPTPLNVGTLPALSVPVGDAIGKVTAQTGLLDLLQTLATALGAPSDSGDDFTLTVAGEDPVSGAFAPDGSVSAVLSSLPPTAAAGSTVAVLAPHVFHVPLLAGTLTCTLADTADDVIGQILVLPAAPGTGGGSGGSTGGSTGGGGASSPGTGSHGAGDTSAGAAASTSHHHRTYSLRAYLLHRTIRSGAHAKVRVVLTASDGTRVSGTAVVKRGKHKVGSHRLRAGRATVKLKHLRPGRYRLKVVVGGLTRTLTLRVMR
jgi:hypothetical protein